MKPDLKRGLGLLVALACTFSSVNAKIWRVNNTPGVNADFSSMSTAVNSALVMDGDTIYLEPSETIYTSITIRKRLVVIGAGYLLGENTGLQLNNMGTPVGSIILDTLASGSHFYGLSGALVYVDSDVDNVKFIRCDMRLSPNANRGAGSKLENWEIKQCRIGNTAFTGANFIWENPVIRNNIFYGQITLANMINGLIRNNLFAQAVTFENSYISNNIFAQISTNTFENCTIRYNISVGNNIPSGGNNQLNVPASSLYIGTGTLDARYQLIPGSPAIAAGEPVGGETPDVGPFGTHDPYRISGLPPVPIFTELTVPASVPSSATTMSITVSVRSNN